MRGPTHRASLMAGCLTAAIAASSTSGCFDPELSDTPFRCAATGKPCPDDYTCDRSLSPPACVKAAAIADVGAPDFRVATDAVGQPSKDGPIYLDGSLVKPASHCDDADSEPNNTAETARQLNGTGKITGWEICYPGDVDHFKYDLEVGQRITVEVLFDHAQGDLDAALLNPDGFVVMESRSETSNEELSLTVTKKGFYTIGVIGFGPATNRYDLRVSIE